MQIMHFKQTKMEWMNRKEEMKIHVYVICKYGSL